MPSHLLYMREQLLGVIFAPDADGPLQHGIRQFMFRLAFRVLGHGCWRISHAPTLGGKRASGQAGQRLWILHSAELRSE